MKLTVGMIGLAHPHSASHLGTLDTLDKVTGVALYDPNENALEQADQRWPKAERTYTDLNELLARTDIPVVFVALPNKMTPETVIRCAQAGKHVVCEKPCARSAAEMRPVVDALERHQVQFLVCYIWRRNPAILKMRELLQAGALGRLTSVELRMVTTQVRLRDPSHWLFKREIAGGGILSWLGCHWLDLLRYLTGQEVVSVSALLDTLSGEAIDVEDVASVSLRLSGGAIASLHAGYLLASGRPGYISPGYDMSIILRGTEGTLQHQSNDNEHVVTLHSATPAWETAPQQTFRYLLPQVPAYGGAHGLAFVEEFITNALTGQGHSPAPAEAAIRVLEILDAIYLAAEQGKTMPVNLSAV